MVGGWVVGWVINNVKYTKRGHDFTYNIMFVFLYKKYLLPSAKLIHRIMNITTEKRIYQCSYLSKFVDPKRYYAVPYTIKQDGTRVNEPSYLIGADLTENQIAILFS